MDLRRSLSESFNASLHSDGDSQQQGSYTFQPNDNKLRRKSQGSLIDSHSSQRLTSLSCDGVEGEGQQSVPARFLALLAVITFGTEANVCYYTIYGVLSLQYLGVPTHLLSVNGIVCSIFGMLLIPALGSFSDGGKNKQKRRMISLMFGLFLFTFGFVMIAVASGVRNTELMQIWKHSNQSSHKYLDTLSSPAFFSNTSVLIHDTYITSDTANNKTNSNDIIGNYSNIKIARSEYDDIHIGPKSLMTDDQAITIPGILGIVGYISIDTAYDASMSQIRTYLAANVPYHQSSEVFISATRVTSIAGFLITCVGMLDLPSFLGPLFGMDGTAAALIAVALGIAVINVLFYMISFATSVYLKKLRFHQEEKDILIPKPKAIQFEVEVTKQVIYSQDEYPPQFKVNLDKRNSNKQNDLKREQRNGNFERTQSDNGSGRISVTGRSKIASFLKKWKFIFERRFLLLLIAMYFTSISSTTTVIYTSNALTIGVLKGDPHGLPGTEGKMMYDQGLRTAALGMFISYITYSITSVMYHKINNAIEQRKLFFFSNAVVCVVVLLFYEVRTVWSYYLTMTFCGVIRCVEYTIPFCMATSFLNDMSRPSLSSSALSSSSSSSTQPDNLGKGLSLIGFSFTLAFLTIAIIMGPLLAYTGSPWSPMAVVIISFGLSLIPLGVLNWI